MPWSKRRIIATSWGAFLLWSVFVQAEERPLALPLGTVVEQDISLGQEIAYWVEVPKDSFLRVVVEQGGCDVVLTLATRDGARIVEVDSPKDSWGPERLVTKLEIVGPYQLTVRAKSGGRYRLSVSTPTPMDLPARRRLAAERFITTAADLQLDGTAVGRSGAVQQYLKALEIWRLEDIELEQARTLYHLAAVYKDLQESDLALESLHEARPLWQTAAEVRGEASTLNLIGSTHWGRGEYPQAEQFYRLALELRKRHGHRCSQAQVLNNLGTLQVAIGKADAALEFYRPALELCDEEEDPALRAALFAGIGGVHRRLGNLLEALHETRRTLPIYRSLGDHRMEASMLSSMAVYHRELGASQQAFEHYQQALNIFRRLADRRSEAMVLNGLGQVYLQLGEPRQALVVLEQALELRRAVGDRRGEAVTLHGLGWAHSQSDSPERAVEFSRQALELRRTLGHRTGEATSLGLLGIIYHQLGRWDVARSALQEALELQTQLGNPRRQAALLRHLGKTHLAAGDPRMALDALQRSLLLERQVQNRVGEVETLGVLAQAEIRLAQLDRGENHLRAARGLVESLRVEIRDPDLRASFLATQRQVYETSIEVAMERHRRQPEGGHDLVAFALSEQARARSFLELLGEMSAKIDGSTTPHLLARRSDLQQRLNAVAARQRRLLARDPAPEVVKELDEELQSLLIELQEVEGEMHHQNPAYGALTRPRVLDAATVQELLDEDTLLLQYFLGEEHSFLWAVTTRAVHSFELPPRREIEDAARALHRLWSILDPARVKKDLAAAEELYRLILQPVASLIHSAQRLVIVADGALQYLPFAALPASAQMGKRGTTLLAEHEVVHLPSASVLAQLRRAHEEINRPRRGLKAADLKVAVVADPIFTSNDPRLTAQPTVMAEKDLLRDAEGESGFVRLPASRLEAQAIASLVPGESTLLLLGGDARREAVMGEHLGDYQVLHFATHGVLDSQRPRLSGLAFSHFDLEGRPVEGFLALHEIYSLQLDAELAVLSGCRTALGKEIRGEGLVGLSRAFMYAGAERVVASLWRVQDRATAELMQHFYRSLFINGERPAQALRSAQLRLAAEPRFRDPYHWAAFVHVGDWR